MAYITLNGPAAGNFAPAAFRTAQKPVASAQNDTKSWLARIVDAVTESRMRTAEREIARHRHLFSETNPLSVDLAASTLPFNR